MGDIITDLIKAVALGLLQGFTEWLPISSSGHLVIAQKLMHIDVSVGFDVMLHVGTLLAVVVFFRKDLLNISRSLMCRKLDENSRMLLYILIGTIPTIIVGILFLRFFESLFLNIKAVGIGFLITGVLLLCSVLKTGTRRLNAAISLLVGFAQAISIAPGISRSGSTISTGLLSGVEKNEAFRYSFLLSVPAVVGASVLELGLLTIDVFGLYSLVGMIVSGFSGYAALKIVQRTLLSNRFYLFAVYCFAAGILTTLVL
jgi:undecaprenyl-diphosphatase